MKKIFYYFLSSFDVFSKGASSNKLAAFSAIMVGIYVTKRFTDVQNIIWVLTIWLLFALLCLGIILFKQITELVQSYKGGNAGKTILEEKQPLEQHLENSPTNPTNNGN